MALFKQQQMTFGGGVNAQFPAHLIPEDTVQTGSNIDFSLERGATRARRGYTSYLTTVYTHLKLFKAYFDLDIADSYLYTLHTSGGGYGFGRAKYSGAYDVIAAADGDSIPNGGFCKFQSYVYMAGNGTNLWKDDGTTTTQWIKQQPPAPAITIGTGSGITAISSGVCVVQEGTAVSTTSGTLTATADPNTGRITLLKTGTFNFGTNTGFVTDSSSVMFANLGFSDPQNIYRISMDVCVGTTVTSTLTETITSGTTTSTITETLVTFPSYWHGEYLPNIGTNITPALPTPDDLTGSVTLSGTNVAINQQAIGNLQSQINSDMIPPLANISFSANSITPLGIPKLSFEFVGTYTGTGDTWQGSPAVRVVVEAYTTTEQMIFTGMSMQGDSGHPLTDMSVGYIWYQTWAQLDSNGNFLGESAMSPPSNSGNPIECMNANGTVTSGGTATGTQAGITHVITYRQGGYCQAPYAVGTQTYSGSTNTLTDTVSDMQALLTNVPGTINVYPQQLFPNNIYIVADQPWFDRMWVSDGKNLYWSTPGRPDQFPMTSYVQIGQGGGEDTVTALIPVLPAGMVIVCANAVYEMSGSVFEGPNADYVIQRANVRKGSMAPQAAVRTPYGIPLLSYDGISMYQPGAGVEVTLPWVIEQIGDAFRGQDTSDSPAVVNGNRVPILNGALFNSCAVYNEGKVYLAVPTGTSAVPNTVFVLDFLMEKCWWYTYGNGTSITINDLHWDFLNNTVLAGGVDAIWQIENTPGEGALTTPIPWSFQSRAWTTPTDSLVENFAIEYVGGPFEVDVIYDGTTTQTLGTCSAPSKTYAHFPMNGLVSNNLSFVFTQLGTSVGTYTPHTAVYGITFNALAHPEKTYFYQTDYNDNNYPGDKLWDVVYMDIGFLEYNPGTSTASDTSSDTINGTGTVTAVTFVDGNAVMTNTCVGLGTANIGRNIFTFSFPAETYGEIAYTTMTSTLTTSGTGSSAVTYPGLFKLWDHRFEARNEPPRVTTWRTTIESLDEAICDAFDVDINPNGTVFGTCFVDNTATMTATITSAISTEGNHRQSYTFAIPPENYGRTIFVLYNAASGNYFKHYNTWFHRRPEPDRWTSYVSDRRSTVEQHFDYFECDINPLGNTVTATCLIDGVAYGTFTYTGSLRDRFVNAFPAYTYGKTVWTQYSVSAGTSTDLNPKPGRFKFFSDHYNGTPEPDRLTFVQKILPPWPSEHYLKTWIAELNPLGSCTGTLLADNFIISTATFTGTLREAYNVGIDLGVASTPALQTATAVEVRYAGSLFKHYETTIESEPKPFGKLTWAISYKKTGGASQIDMARFWSIDVEAPPGGGAIMTSVWDIDGQSTFSTNTFTLPEGRTYIDRIPFPPGGRGRLFQQRVSFSNPCKVWASAIDEEHVGVKGLARASIQGTPRESQWADYRYADSY